MGATTRPLAVEGPDWAGVRTRVASIDVAVPAVVALALLVRVLYWRLEIPHYTPLSDAAAYYEIGRYVAEGHGFSHTFPQLYLHPTAFRPPLFPLLLGALFWLFGASVGLAQGVNLLIGLGVVALGMVLAGELGLDRVGQVASGVALAVYPPLVYNDVVVLTEPLSILFLLAAAILLSRQRLVWAGVATGLLVLTRTSAQLVLPVIALWVLWQLGWRNTLRFTLVVVAVIAPWSIRNRVEVGTWSLATSNGFNLAAEYAPPALDAKIFIDPVFDPFFQPYRLTQFHEAAWDKELTKVGLRSIKATPSAPLRVFSQNVGPYFEVNRSRNYMAEMLDGRNTRFRDRLTFIVLPFAILGTFGLVLLLRRPLAVLLFATSLYFVLSSLFLITAPRLRAPVEAVWCLGIGALVAAVVERAPKRRAAHR